MNRPWWIIRCMIPGIVLGALLAPAGGPRAAAISIICWALAGVGLGLCLDIYRSFSGKNNEA